MIRTIQITLNAAHPELPLIEASTYVGSPSTAFVRGVPAAIGNWKITAVRVIFHYPDESVVAAACVNSATGVWVGTIAPTATSGRIANGYQVLADGIDENGDAVTGYVLGMGDLAVYTRDMTIDAGETVWYLHYFDTAPTTPKKGDVATVNGVLKLYNGTAWVAFAAGITLDDAVTRTSANGVKSSGIWAAIWGALAARPTGFTSLYDWCVEQLRGKASTADATLNERGMSDWTIKREGVDVTSQVRQPSYDDMAEEWLIGLVSGDDIGVPYASGDSDATALSWTAEDSGHNSVSYTATRTALSGYQLGAQANKPLASEAEAEALRAGKLDKAAVIAPSTESSASGKAADAKATGDALAAKQDALTSQQLANIADVPNKANAADLPYAIALKQVVNSTVAVDDRTVNLVQGSYSTTVAVSIPSRVSNKSRDFIITFSDGVDTTITIGGATLCDPSGASISTLNAKAQTLAFWRLTEIANGSENVNPMFLVTGANQLSASDVIDPANATASGKAADALATKNALGGKQASITASGILKGDGQGGVSAATAGTDYQSPLGYTPENAANKVTSLSAQSTDTQYPSAKCVYDALANVDAKPTRIYNSAGTDALDDKGQLYMPGLTGNYFEYNGTTYSYHGYESGMFGSFYTYYDPTATRWLCYNKNTGAVFEASVGMIVAAAYTIAVDLNPLNGDDLSPTTSGTGFTFHKREQSPASVLYAKFAIESLPDATIAASTSYDVGSLVKDTTTNKAYRCKAMYTTGTSPTAPSSDSAHWDEIPVLAQKADAADLRYSFNAATVGTGTTPTVSNVLDRAINSATLGSSVTAATITLPAATSGKARDFFIDLTIEATTAPTLTFIDPATGTTANVTFGADALADIAPGYNLILWTELPNNRWLVSVKHEEAAS